MRHCTPEGRNLGAHLRILPTKGRGGRRKRKVPGSLTFELSIENEFKCSRLPRRGLLGREEGSIERTFWKDRRPPTKVQEHEESSVAMEFSRGAIGWSLTY